jgi:bifunctional non-homologous end joining protein LigD
MHRGTDCRGWPLIERKQALAELLADKPLVILCAQHVVGEGKWLFEHVLALELEGMVAMRLASVYKSGERPGDWLKIKRPGAVPA